MQTTTRTVRLWWDTHEPTNPRWASTVTPHVPDGWAEVESGELSDAAWNGDTEAEVIAGFRRECPPYAGDVTTVEEPEHVDSSSLLHIRAEASTGWREPRARAAGVER